MPGMLEGVAARTFAPLLLRAALAARVHLPRAGQDSARKLVTGCSWAQEHGRERAAGADQSTAVATPRRLGRTARRRRGGARHSDAIAALGLLIIMVGAIFTYTGHHGFSAATGKVTSIISCSSSFAWRCCSRGREPFRSTASSG